MVTGQGTNRLFEIQHFMNRTDEGLYLDGFWTDFLQTWIFW